MLSTVSIIQHDSTLKKAYKTDLSIMTGTEKSQGQRLSRNIRLPSNVNSTYCFRLVHAFYSEYGTRTLPE